MKVAAYIRVSTEDQREALQQDAVHQYVSTRGLVLHKEYIDKISGGTSKRPALDELLADARRRRFDAIVVWKIDRLGRSVQHLLTVLGELQSLGIQFISLQEAIDTGTPAGRMVFTFLGAVAEFERSIISERVRAGMAAAKLRGKHCGRPKQSMDEETVVQMRSNGASMRKIAKSVGCSHQSVANILASSPK